MEENVTDCGPGAVGHVVVAAIAEPAVASSATTAPTIASITPRIHALIIQTPKSAQPMPRSTRIIAGARRPANGPRSPIAHPTQVPSDNAAQRARNRITASTRR